MRVGSNVRRPIAGLAGAAVVFALAPAMSASADPSARDWHRLRMCESGENYSIDTGNGHYGAYQFDLGTWRSVGGHGKASNASAGEQDARALILYRQRGWQPWQCASIEGLREDKDARSGRISDIKVPGSKSLVPAWPGRRYYHRGDTSSTIKRWKAQMRTRGAVLNGGATLGARAEAVVNRIQSQNGLPATGVLGPVTWKLAWTGKFTPAATAPAPGDGPVGRAPAMPHEHWYSRGDSSPTIAAWQAQMHRRGAALRATGHFGAKTERVVKAIQGRNGLRRTGILGPVTWALAWTGRYR